MAALTACCKNCGNKRGYWRNDKAQFLCKPCNQETKPKVSRECFEAVYWRGKAAEVSRAIRREFYEDYKYAFKGGLAEYIAATTCKA